jgi:hypothetical protein
MAETGDGFTGLPFGPHVIGGARRIADLFSHLHDVFGGTAVRGTRQCGDGCRNRSVQIRLGADHDPRGE